LRAGYDFLLLRCDGGETPAELGQWWTRFLEADEKTREHMVQQRPDAETTAAPRKRRRGGRRKSNANSAPAAASTPGDGDRNP
jgi:poly(A) polymerase